MQVETQKVQYCTKCLIKVKNIFESVHEKAHAQEVLPKDGD